MEFVRITSIEDTYFRQMHELMGRVFPPEEVLAYDLWAEPLKDEGLRVVVAVHEGEVVGATEYRYYPDMGVAMTDFTIIGREGLGIGRFLAQRRQSDLLEWVRQCGGKLTGMFAEIYNPYLVEEHAFGGIKPMDPFVRREVLSHLGYRRLDFPYVHPSWELNGEAVSGLDFCFLSYDESVQELPAALVSRFLQTYYAIQERKPDSWYDMIRGLERLDTIKLLPI
ncbi:GNAT family N-acetyltransferase [Paenibacillus ginsengarvi]|uniref:GNAT family N-acetyltransferase n=1 Tax=Paenibacillus ginsengarvi TaxID=400777 RepID=A0A3B0AV42_9BACL|nr:GNAT family N-acetyltransferase [Paenibacillus ginsengarvi]RKN64304.1 GNAT family N-acetyltransferase [Paenibacillus ginsengarvi]